MQGGGIYESRFHFDVQVADAKEWGRGNGVKVEVWMRFEFIVWEDGGVEECGEAKAFEKVGLSVVLPFKWKKGLRKKAVEFADAKRQSSTHSSTASLILCPCKVV